MITFRKALPKDAEEIILLRKEAYTKNPFEKYPEEVIKYLLSKDTIDNLKNKIIERDMFCLINGNEIIGTIALKENEITSVFVKYNQIRNRFGTKLIEFIEQKAREKKLKKIKLNSAEKSVYFYEKKGYKIVKKIEEYLGENKKITFDMEKEI